MTDEPHRKSLSGAALKVDLALIGKRAAIYADGPTGENTDIAYRGQWSRYLEWCQVNGFDWVEGGTEPICMYLTYLTDVCNRAPNTLRQVLSALRSRYRRAMGDENPAMARLVGRTLSACCRENARKPDRKRPMRARHLLRIIHHVEREGGPGPARGRVWARDKAMLLVGWSGAYRRSELTALKWADVVFRRDGTARIFLEHSKTDQTRHGHWSEIAPGAAEATCPVRSLKAWAEYCTKPDGSLSKWMFRAVHEDDGEGAMEDRHVNRIVKKYGASAGLNPDNLGGHSLRAGWITDANAAGMSAAEIMKHSRHRSFHQMQTYNRPHESFVGDLTKKIGL